MRLHLHGKILVATVIPLLGLTAAALWTVNRSISEQAQRQIRDDLVRAASTFEDILAARSEELEVTSRVIVEDPKFFSVLTLPVSAKDPELRATAEGVALDFNAITHADLFLVFDARGTVVADASAAPVGTRDWPAWMASSRGRGFSSSILVDHGRHYQVALAPVRAGSRTVGFLLVGAEIGQGLAERLRALTRSEVTFVSGATLTGSTLEISEDRRRLAVMLARRGLDRTSPGGAAFTFEGAGSSYVTVIRDIPGSVPGEGQRYAMQRSLQRETAFLAPMRATLLGIGLLAVVVSVGVGYLISRGITAPVRTLVRGAEEMERGNYDYPLDVRGRDEIGYLARRFRDMRQQQRVYVKTLEEVARLKGDFIDLASHELRTPLSVLKGFVELMSQERLGPLTSTQREALSAMEGSVATLTRISEDAWRVSQIQSERFVLSPGAHDVRLLLQEAADRASRAGRHRSVTLRVEPGRPLPPVIVDGPRLTEAVTHLLTNAIRFTPDGGRVVVRASVDGPDLLIEVEDTGAGIPEDKLQKLLERSLVVRDPLNHHSSSTLEFNSAGLGLGIPIVRGVAEAHGGGLHARPRPSGGMVFLLRVPAGGSAREEAA